MTDTRSTDVEVALTFDGPILYLRHDGEVDGYLLTGDDLAVLADRATQALAESRGWEFITDRPAVTIEEGNILAFCTSPVRFVQHTDHQNLTFVGFEDGTRMRLDSNTRVSYLRRIA